GQTYFLPAQGHINQPVQRPRQRLYHRPGDKPMASQEEEVDEEESFKEEVDRLIRRHRNEKYAPELLPYDKEMVHNISEVLHFVAEALEEYRSNGQAKDLPHHYLRSTEAERLTYMLSDYLRLRLWKLSKYPLHYMDPQRQMMLSSAERIWLHEFWDNKRMHFQHRFLAALPEKKQALDEQVDDNLDMIRRPQMDTHIYARICGDVGTISPSLHASPGVSSTPGTKDLRLFEGPAKSRSGRAQAELGDVVRMGGVFIA
ncbi:unnamed protein product, partial [Effrenium voratum]